MYIFHSVLNAVFVMISLDSIEELNAMLCVLEISKSRSCQVSRFRLKSIKYGTCILMSWLAIFTQNLCFPFFYEPYIQLKNGQSINKPTSSKKHQDFYTSIDFLLIYRRIPSTLPPGLTPKVGACQRQS